MGARIGYLIFTLACAVAAFTALSGIWWALVMSKESLTQMFVILGVTVALGTAIVLTGGAVRYMLGGR